MRASTIISLILASVLAILAVIGVRGWLADQRERIALTEQQRTNEDMKTIVVAKTAMRFGERITAEKLDVIPWASPNLPPGSFSKVEDLAGTTEETARFVLASMEQGEPVLSSKVTTPGQRAKLSTALSPGMKAVSIRVNDVLGVAGFVLPGDRVDVMLTRANMNDDEEAYVDVLLQGVKVLAIDQIADDRKDQPSVVQTVTFEVSTEEAQKLTLGATVGTLSLALRNVVSADIEDSERMTLDELSVTAASAELARAQAEAQAQAEAEARAAEQQLIEEQAAKLAALEQAIQSLGSDVAGKLQSVEENVAGRLQSVEENLTTRTEPVVVEKEVVKVVEKLVEVAPPAPEYVSVGIVRNGQREEYRVNHSQDE
ncbi:Flp pilus assembly protein CpaB [Aliigemmobacter aestuarii]|uniref:Flp pilus assembly protein CpaB n=1 Tax=Aliigemmobacter aestuarii TaxID=1445661 RepID=A0A4S3ML03_9RHOB|nr:Flp pilus assembly protein CpaB [Gemmobacter aestuarii]THD82453.1 Flp pilus assembly protein CpaB [Gemmobacter aestuarii]